MTAMEYISPYIDDCLCGALLFLCAYWVYRFFAPDDLLRDRSATRRRSLMGALMLWQCIIIFYSQVVWWLGISTLPHIKQLMFQLDTVSIPLIVLVFTDLTHRKTVSWSLALWHVLPFALFACVGALLQRRVLLHIEVAYLAVYLSVFLPITIRSWIRYNRLLRDNFGAIEPFRPAWSLLTGIELAVLLCNWVACYLSEADIVWQLYFVIAFCMWAGVCRRVYAMIVAYETATSDPEAAMAFLSAAESLHPDADSTDDVPDDVSHVPGYAADAQKQTLYEALQEAVNRLSERPALSQPVDEAKQRRQQQAVERFRSQLIQVCEEPKLFTNEDITRLTLSDLMGISAASFTRMLNRATGKTFYQYINDLRIDYAEQLLRDFSVSIDRIPQMVGYKSTARSTFYRAFFERHHCTPSAYRKSVEIAVQ